MMILPVCTVSYVYIDLALLGLIFPILMFGLLFWRKKIKPRNMLILQLILFFSIYQHIYFKI